MQKENNRQKVSDVYKRQDYNQTVKAIAEAEAYPGPSLIIAYAPCINHGIKKGLSKAQMCIRDRWKWC